jgi:multicomponent Na+:H+ antiporter subunit C
VIGELDSIAVYSVTAVLLVAVGLHGLLVRPEALRKVLAVNVMSIGVFMLLLAVAAAGGSTDPVPHALVLTGIVVAVALTALAVALVRRLASDDEAREPAAAQGERGEGS